MRSIRAVATDATVLTDVPVEARVMNEEPFGPIAPIASFTTFEEVMQEVNRLPLGLASYAYTRSISTAARFSAEAEAGMVSINHFGLGLPESPFGGIKDSGYGSGGGAEAMDAFLSVKFVSTNSGS